MKGTKVARKVVVITISLVVVIMAIAMNNRSRINAVDTSPKNKSESNQFSFIEGVNFGVIYYRMTEAYSKSQITKTQYNKFEKMSDNLLEDFSVSTQREIYEYVAKVLKYNYIDFYYHEGADSAIFMEGFAVKSAKYMIDTFYENGDVSKESKESILVMYNEMLENYSNEEQVEKYLSKVTEVLLETRTEKRESFSVLVL